MAKGQGEDFQLVLTRFVLERFLYRLGCSQFREQFILKGAMLFPLWGNTPHRATRDIDLLGFGESAVTRLVQIFQAVCLTRVEEDGVIFLQESVGGMEIREDQEYDGVRITLEARLGVARIPVQVDIGFGDEVIPSADFAEYPAALDFPAPFIRVYPRETVIAEKFQAMIYLGMANSRMKDFYDLWIMGRTFSFEGRTLTKAIGATFLRRRTAFADVLPLALTVEFSEDPSKQTQWRAFIKRNQLAIADLALPSVIAEIREFLQPPMNAAARRESFDFIWPPGGPWRQVAEEA
jgi:predicted nucleotidyltransferase component of viral defense system